MMKSLLFTLLGFFCVQSAFCESLPKEVRLAYIKSPLNLQTIVLKKKGFLEEELAGTSVLVRWHDFRNGNQKNIATAAEKIDILPVINTASLLMIVGSGTKMQVLGGVARPGKNFALVSKVPLKTQTLKGKRIAGPKGTVLHQLLLKILAKHNLTEKDITFVSMSIPAAASALEAGHVDAALLTAGTLERIKATGAKTVITAENHVRVNLVCASRREFSKAYPTVVSKFLKAHHRAYEWILEHPSEAIRLGAEENNIPTELAEKIAKNYDYYETISEEDILAICDDAAFLKKEKLLRHPIDVKSLLADDRAKPLR